MSGKTYNQSIPSRGQVLGKALIQVQQALRLTQKELSEIIHTSESTISRYKNGNPLDPTSAEAEFAKYFIRIYRNLDTLLGGEDIQSKDWLTHYNEHLGDKPINLIKNMYGIHEVLNYLDAMRGLA